MRGRRQTDRQTDRQTETKKAKSVKLKRSITLNREVTIKALDRREEQEKLKIKERGREEIDQQKSTEK